MKLIIALALILFSGCKGKPPESEMIVYYGRVADDEDFTNITSSGIFTENSTSYFVIQPYDQP